MSKTKIKSATLHESLFAPGLGDLGKVLGAGGSKTAGINATLFYGDGILEVTVTGSLSSGTVTMLVPLSNVKMMTSAPVEAPAPKK